MQKKIHGDAVSGQKSGTHSVIPTCRRAKRLSVLTAAVVGIVGFGTRSADATDHTWQGASVTFSASSNWSPSGAPGASTDDAIFNSGSTGISSNPTFETTPTAFGGIWATGAGTTPYEISFNNKSFTLDGNTNASSALSTGVGILVDIGNSLTLDGGSLSTSNLQVGGVQTWTINGTLAFQNFSTAVGLANALTIGGSGTTTIPNKMNGAGALTINGTGNLSLVGSGTADTYTGQLTIQAGTLKVDAVNATSSNGELGGSGNTNATIMGGSGTTGTLEDSGMGTASTGRGFTMFNGGTGDFQVDGSSSILKLTGTITGTGGALSTSGAGTVILLGTNTYSGGTTVSSGTLTDSGTGAAGSGVSSVFGSGSISVNPSGTLVTQPAELIANSNTSISTTAAVVVNNNSAAVGTLAFNSAAPTIGSLAGNGNVVLADASASNLTIGNAGSTTFSGVISATNSSSGLTKAGSGTLTLSGANTYAGGTTLSAGTLYVNNTPNSGTGTGSVSVNAGTLGGTGTISGSVAVAAGATLSPGVGAAANTLTTGAVTSNGTGNTTGTASNYSFAIDSTTLTNDELVVSAGSVSLGSGISLLNVTDLTPGQTVTNAQFVLINAAGGVSGTFSGIADNTPYTVGSNTYTISYDQGGGDEVTLTVATPEPAAMGILGLGGIMAMRRRRQPARGAAIA